MKKIWIMLAAVVSAAGANAGVVTDTVITGASYVNQIWYSLPNDEQGSAPKDNWDVAFQISGYAASILANTQKGLQVFQSPYSAADWANVDTAGISGWAKLHNSDKTWDEGAFNANPDGNFDLGWGTYDLNTHTVAGDSVYVMKFANGGAWKKFKIDALISGTYTFTWADLNGSNSQTGSVAKSNYTGKNFAYFSLENNAALNNEPLSANWDITFTKYITPLPYQGAILYYGVSGLLQNKNVTAIKAYPVNDVSNVNYNDYTFQTDINTIGYDWKTYDMGSSSYEIADSTVYFVQRSNSDVWKIIFTGFDMNTGSYIFSKELIYAAATGIEETNEVNVLSIYPNPAHNRFQIIYDYKNADAKNTGISIYDLSGRIVKQENFNLLNGFNQHTVDVSSLNAGIYMISIPALNKTQKLIVE